MNIKNPDYLESSRLSETQQKLCVITSRSACRHSQQAEQSPPRRWRERERSESRVCVNGNDEFSLQTRAVPFNARRSNEGWESSLKKDL